MQVEKPATSRVVDDGRRRQVRRHIPGAEAQRTLKVALDLVTRRARFRRLPNEIEILRASSPRRSHPEQARCDGHARANGPTAAARTHREAIAKATNEQKLFVRGLLKWTRAIPRPERGNRKIGKIGKAGGFYTPISRADILPDLLIFLFAALWGVPGS
jgi:hypothetical protein